MQYKKRRSPTEILYESNKHTPEYETAHIKFPREDPIEVAIKSKVRHEDQQLRDGGGFINPVKLFLERLKRGYRRYSRIHNHATTRNISYSFNDIYFFVKNKGIKTDIAYESNPKTGQIEGYVFLRKTKKTPHLSRKEKGELRTILNRINKIRSTKEHIETQDEEVNKVISRYNLQLRYVPAKGFRYNKEKDAFVSKLEMHPNPIIRELYNLISGYKFDENYAIPISESEIFGRRFSKPPIDPISKEYDSQMKKLAELTERYEKERYSDQEIISSLVREFKVDSQRLPKWLLDMRRRNRPKQILKNAA